MTPRRFVLLLFLMSPSIAFPDDRELARMSARFAPVKLSADTSKLDPGDAAALTKLLSAAKVMDDLYLKQLWQGNPTLRERLRADRSRLGRARFSYYWLNKGP